MALDIKLEEPQPINGDIKDFQRILDKINRELARIHRNEKQIKTHAKEDI